MDHRIINIDTGLPPTDEESEEIRARARQIVENWRYSSPEQLEWAMMVDPEGWVDALCGTLSKG